MQYVQISVEPEIRNYYFLTAMIFKSRHNEPIFYFNKEVGIVFHLIWE